MHINDINGQRIEVIDLTEAIKQASAFTTMKHDDASFNKLDESLTFTGMTF